HRSERDSPRPARTPPVTRAEKWRDKQSLISPCHLQTIDSVLVLVVPSAVSVAMAVVTGLRRRSLLLRLWRTLLRGRLLWRSRTLRLRRRTLLPHLLLRSWLSLRLRLRRLPHLLLPLLEVRSTLPLLPAEIPLLLLLQLLLLLPLLLP